MLNNKEIPIGLSIPLMRGPHGYFDQNFNTLDQAYSNIKNLLLTIYGERRMNVNFGSSIYSLVFEQVTDPNELISSLTTQINSLIFQYFPYIDITNLNIGFLDTNINMINIEIEFQLKNSTNKLFGKSETRTINTLISTNI